MLREYEFTMILSPNMAEENTKKLIEKYEGMILEDGGQLVNKADWGSKKLAFSMKKQYRGRYVHYDLTAKPENLRKAEGLMRIDENVLRYMSVRIGENINVDERKAELAKIEAQAAAQKEASSSFKDKARS